ncbi:hypothetical protein [Exiguobacterium sp. S22-S28]|uniref:hypothetical protein n=1 Tax=Exiguobacterium sp. S22-S28 TaxID=3342768 RepID=UPI00372CFA97
MDLKRYEKVTGHEALIKLLDGERIYNRKGNYWTRKGEGIFVNYEDENGEYESTIPVIWFVDSTVDWYVKKPFDVRAEMLARPNEWVGVYKDESEIWNKVGFCTTYMNVRETSDFEHDSFEKTFICLIDDFNKCIPIEDVPKEELS